ncbi:MAG: hypothetical protein KDE19_14170 [Caldilineaceae bacterium]|nr:hypothetical protein [Caldilineaceae bacterium]
MHYHHRFEVKAPLQDVVAFHQRSASMAAITPPPIIVRMQSTPDILTAGDEMRFTLWLGPLPIHWQARIEDIDGIGFLDRQLSGPFTQWEHRHIFESVDEQTTAVIDEVTVTLSRHWFWRFVGLGMWLNLPILFAFRGWKTKRILEQEEKTLVTSNRAH